MATIHMQRATIVVLKQDWHRCTHALMVSELFEPCEEIAWEGSDLHLTREQASNLLAAYADLEHQIRALLNRFGETPEPELVAQADPIEDLAPVRQAVDELRAQLLRYDRERDELHHRIRFLERLQALQRGLADKGLSLEAIRRARRLLIRLGWISRQALMQVQAAISAVPAMVEPIAALGHETLVLAVAVPAQQDTIDHTLFGAGFQPQQMEPPEEIGAPENVPSMLEALRARAAHLERTYADIQRHWLHRLRETLHRVYTDRLILECEQFSGVAGPAAVFQGWVPETDTATVEAHLARATQGRYWIRWELIAFDASEPHPKTVVPIFYRNPIIMQPFQQLVRAYGEPVYGEIDPTPIFALSFLLMFGMMFGDLGHGAVLALIGYGLFRRMPGREDLGILFMECGASSMLFGMLYGNVFGLEALPALWFRPMEHVSFFLNMSLLFGMSMITLGFALNIVNALRRRAYAEAAFGKNGLAAALLYWILVGLALRYAFGEHHWAFLDPWIMGIVAILFVLVLFHQPLLRWIHGQRPLIPPPVWTSLFESVIETVDTVARYAANTVSFLRVAAFALMHVALFIVIFTLADMLAHVTGGTFWYWLTITLGNVLVIVVEGVIVTIQILRLEYYEFFSKFYSGEGRPFRPMARLVRARQQEG
ncbi:MAG: hypothetical protein D6690_00770 [Nitrospirae bacterium]|nr:MAG: hypothetical protein D6690_00770 [Nitrospirota bacterium]